MNSHTSGHDNNRDGQEEEEGKKFFGRQWVFQKLIKEPGMVVNSFNCSMLLGALGSGKSAILNHLADNAHLCGGVLLAQFQCTSDTNAFDFVFSIASQLQKRIPYLQVPSRQQLADLYVHNVWKSNGGGGGGGVDGSFAGRSFPASELTHAGTGRGSQWSNLSTEEQSELYSMDMNTITTSDQFNYSFGVGMYAGGVESGGVNAFWTGQPYMNANLIHGTTTTGAATGVGGGAGSSVYGAVDSCAPAYPTLNSKLLPKQFSTASSFDCYSVDSGGGNGGGGADRVGGGRGGEGSGTRSSMMLPSLNGLDQRTDARDIFWRYVLEPIIDHGLNRWEDRCFLLLIDSIDVKREICELVSRHLLVLPNFLHVIVSARPGRRKGFSRMFNGCRKVIIDDTRKDAVLEDMRLYVRDEAQRRQVILNDNQLNRLCICSDGCYLYPQLYLSALNVGVISNDMMPPATLNGLYFILFSLLFDQLPVASQTLVRHLFSLLLAAEQHQLTDQQAQRLLMEDESDKRSEVVDKSVQPSFIIIKTKELKQPKKLHWTELLSLLQRFQLISLEQTESHAFTELDWSEWTEDLASKIQSPELPPTPETPVARILTHQLIRPALPSLLSWISDVKHCGRKFHCSSELGHLLQVLRNPSSQQSGWALAQHVQACGLAGMAPNVQAMLFLIHCHPHQLPKLSPLSLDSTASHSTPETKTNLAKGLSSQSKSFHHHHHHHPQPPPPPPPQPQQHPLILFIQNCVQTPVCRSPAYEESTQDGTEAELISDVLGELHSGCDLQLQISSIDNASEEVSDPGTHSPRLAVSPAMVGRITPTSFLNTPSVQAGLRTPLTSTGGIVSPNVGQSRWTPSPNSNRPQLAEKLVFDRCQLDPSTLTFDVEQLLAAITDEDESLLRLLLENCGQLLHAYDERGLTPLFHAIDGGCSGRLLDFLTQFELDVNQPSEQLRRTPLMLTAVRDQLELAERLLEMDADVNAKDVDGNSALIWAVKTNASVAMVRLLLYWGGEGTELDDQGRSLISLAVIASAEACEPVQNQIGSSNVVIKDIKQDPTTSGKVTISDETTTKRNPSSVARSAIHPTLIRFIPTFSQSRYRTSSASAAQACWVRNSQLLEADNSQVLPNSSYEHRLFQRRLRPESDCGEQRDLNTLQVIRALVDAGARAEVVDQEGRTLLHWAAVVGVTPLLLDYLVQLGGKRLLETLDRKGWLPIHCAAAAGRIQLLKPLSSGGLLHRLTTDGLTVLGCAVQSFQFDAVISLVRRCGARLDQLNDKKCSVLYWVTNACGRRLVRLRKQRKQGALDQEDGLKHDRDEDKFLLPTLSDRKDCSLDKLFRVDIGHLSSDDSDGEIDSPISKRLTLKAEGDDDDDNGEEEEEDEDNDDDDEEDDDDDNDGEAYDDINDEDEEGRNDEEYRKKIRMLKLLIALGADLECRDGNGRTALHVAAYLDDRRAAQLLLSGGSKVDSVDDDGRTPLHMCAFSGAYGTAQLLLKQGQARPDWRSTDGNCALAISVRFRRKRICALLLKAGADVRIRDSSGQTPLDWIKRLDSIEGQRFRSIFKKYSNSIVH